MTTRLILKASTKLASGFGRPPTVFELANETSLSPLEIDACLLALNIRASLGKASNPFFSKEGGDLPNEDIYLVSQNLGPEDLFEAKEELRSTYRRVKEVLDCLTLLNLPKRYVPIFRMRYGLNENGEPQTLEAIGDQLATNKVQIHRILKNIWDKLKEAGIEGGEKWLLREVERIRDLEDLTNQVEPI